MDQKTIWKHHNMSRDLWSVPIHDEGSNEPMDYPTFLKYLYSITLEWSIGRGRTILANYSEKRYPEQWMDLFLYEMGVEPKTDHERINNV